MKYAAAALILFVVTSVGLALGRAWRHRSTAGFEVGAVSQRWLSENRREDEP